MSSTRRKLFSVLALFVLLVAVVIGCASEIDSPPGISTYPGIPTPDYTVEMPKFLRLEGASSPGSASDLQSAAVAEAVKSFFPKIAVRRFPCGSAEATIMLQHKKLDLCFYGVLQNIIPQWKGEYKGYEGEKMQDIRLLGANHLGLLGHIFYVPADTPYRTAADLLEKEPLRIGVGPVGSASWVTCKWALEAYGLTYEGIEAKGGLVYFGALGDTASMVAEGKLDAFAYGLSHPSPVLSELDLRRGVRCLPWSEEAIKHVTGPAEHGLFPITLPGGTYKGTPEDVTIIGYMCAYMVHKDMPDEVAYNLTAALYHPDGLKLLSDRVTFIKGYIETTPDLTAMSTWPFPSHPGALKYWSKRGVTLKVELIE